MICKGINRTTAAMIVLGLVMSEIIHGGQTRKEITPEWVFSDSAENISAVPTFKWLEDGTLMLCDHRVEAGRRTFERFDPKTGKIAAMLDMPKAMTSLRSLRNAKNTDTLVALPWPDACDDRGRRATYGFDSTLFLLDFATASFRKLTDTKTEEKSVRFAPDGTSIAFVHDNDLYLYDIAHNSERRLTEGGADTLLNGTLPWVYWEEIFNHSDVGYWWSADSKSIAFLQTNQALVDSMFFVAFDDFQAKISRQSYPRAGDANPRVRLGMVSVADGRTVWASFPASSYEYIVNVNWLPGSQSVAVETMNRAQNQLDLYLVSRADGSLKHILTEIDSAWVDQCQPVCLSDEKQFIWLSERDGFAHLFRYDLSGKLTNQITKGEWSALPSISFSRKGLTAPIAVDEKAGWVYFISTEKSPLERQLYRIKLDGSSRQQLSREAGTHNVSISPDLRYYVDQHSSLSSLPSLSVYKSDGYLLKTIAMARPELLKPSGLQYPTVSSFTAADGLALPCMVTKPQDFDAVKKYPVIIKVYGGPAAPMIVDSWDGEGAFSDQILLNLGYLVVSFDNRSSALVSRKRSTKIKGDLWGRVELDDLLAFVHWLKQQSYIDSSRIGITGWSGGGTYTLLGMTRTDEFKAGIAGAPVTHWRYYDTKYTEAYMNKPEDNRQGYDSTSLVASAASLHGRLLLIFGTGDDNVHNQNSWAFADKLIEAGKTFGMMIYPMRKHGFEDDAAKIHRLKTSIEFWKDNL